MDSIVHRRASVTGVTFVFATTSLCVAALTQAQQKSPFILTAYSDAIGGERIGAGQYDAALVQIRSSRKTAASAEVVSKTNACVAYAVLRKLDEARAACDEAVIAATRGKTHASGIVSKSRTDEDESVAITYTNRAVVHSMSHEAVSSAEDLAEAHTLAPTSEFVLRNIAAFRQTPGITMQVQIASRRIDD
jgi:hypothetical protein